MSDGSNDGGFTLIEALVAMAILAVASAGLIRATEAHIDLIRGIETRTIAGWVAENRLAEAALPGVAQPPTVTMLGRDWRVTTTSRASDDPDLAAVEIAVATPDATTPVVTLRGFVDRGAAR